MKRHLLLLLPLFAAVFYATTASGQAPHSRVLAFYSTHAEPDHVQFAEGALKFFAAIAPKDNFTFDATTDWESLNEAYLKPYQLVIWLNGSPTKPEQRRAFEKYMETGGAWLGFHAAGYNDKGTGWPWFVAFLGGAVFHNNSWPPLPARLVVDVRTHPATMNLPDAYVSPACEWYGWDPSPRLDKNVQVLLTLDPSNYPLGLKDVVTSGDLPVVWTNQKYKMVYMNMGHGDRIFSSPIQNRLIENVTLWLGTMPAPVEHPAPSGLQINPHAVVANPKTAKVYAVNTGGSTVTVIDNSGHSATALEVGARPEAIAVNPSTDTIYVGNSGSGTVSVIDGAATKVTATVKVGNLPYAVAVNPVTNKVYVSRTFSNTMTVIDGATNIASPLKPGIQADAIAVNPMTNKIYLVNYESSDVTVIDGANDSTTRIAAGAHLWGIAVNPATNRIYFGNTGGSKVTVIDGASNAVTSVSAGSIPCAFAVDSAANKIYAANYASNDVTVLDGANDRVVATVKVGDRPQAIAVNPLTHMIYVANTHSNSVTVIDGTNNSVAATVQAGNGPYAIAVDTAANRIYVTNIAGDHLTMIDGGTLTATPVAAPARQ
jgi:YVTN family beta-propeller protein